MLSVRDFTRSNKWVHKSGQSFPTSKIHNIRHDTKYYFIVCWSVCYKTNRYSAWCLTLWQLYLTHFCILLFLRLSFLPLLTQHLPSVTPLLFHSWLIKRAFTQRPPTLHSRLPSVLPPRTITQTLCSDWATRFYGVLLQLLHVRHT